MKDIKNFINEWVDITPKPAPKPEKGWCLWDYKDHGERILLVWKGNGHDQSDVTEIDEDGWEIMNAEFSDILKYKEDHYKDKYDKIYLDISNVKEWIKIQNLFK